MSLHSSQPKMERKYVSFSDFIGAGVSLIISTTVVIGVYGWFQKVYQDAGFDDSTRTEEELITIHNELEKHRSEILTCVALIWLAVPFSIIHIGYFKTICETLFESIISRSFDSTISSVEYLKWSYIFCFQIYFIFGQLLAGIFLFLGCYYEWEFTTISGTTSYTGYYIQYMLINGAIVVAEMSTLFVGITALIQWLLIFISNIDLIASKDLCCWTWCCFNLFNQLFIRLLMFVFMLVIIFVMFVGTFDWATSGFFSIEGVSADLEFLLFASYELIGFWYIYLACKTETINEIVKNHKENFEYTKLEGV